MHVRRVWEATRCLKRQRLLRPVDGTLTSAVAFSSSGLPAKMAGKSGGFRTIILFKVGGHSFFAHGFAKNEKSNVTSGELKALKALADTFLGFDAKALETASMAGEIAEIKSDDEDGKNG